MVRWAACAGAWGSPENSGSKTLEDHGPEQWSAKDLYSFVSTDGSARACGVGVCARLVPTLSGPRDTSGPGIDRIPPTRPPWWRRQYRELKNYFFSPPRKCPIDLFGPVANRTILEKLHVAFAIASILHAASYLRSRLVELLWCPALTHRFQNT